MKRCQDKLVQFLENIVGPAAKRPKKTTSETIVVHNAESKISNAAAPSPIDIFGLNDDCVIQILEHCSIPDLFNMAQADDRLRIAVIENGGLRKRMFDFGELGGCCHILEVFKVFGQQMTKIKIGEKDIQYTERKYSKFDEILRLISLYCSVDTLKHLTIQYYYGTRINKRFLYESLQHFRSIESFVINETVPYGNESCQDYFLMSPAQNRSVDNLVERILSNAINITSIEISKLKITGRFFYAENIRNLETLSLRGCEIRIPDGFISFLQGKPKLKSFTWDNTYLRGMDTDTTHSSNIVYELVANNIPELESLYYDPNEGFLNERNEYDMDFLFMVPDFQLLANFTKLKILSLSPLTPISVNNLKLLAQKNTIEKLLARFFVGNNQMNLSFLQNFTSLKCVDVSTSFFENLESFNSDLLSMLPNINECHLYFNHYLGHKEEIIEKTVKSAKNLSTLKVCSGKVFITNGLYSCLIDVRTELGLVNNKLTIYIRKNSVARCLSHLKHNYKPDVIAIRASD